MHGISLFICSSCPHLSFFSLLSFFDHTRQLAVPGTQMEPIVRTRCSISYYTHWKIRMLLGRCCTTQWIWVLATAACVCCLLNLVSPIPCPFGGVYCCVRCCISFLWCLAFCSCVGDVVKRVVPIVHVGGVFIKKAFEGVHGVAMRFMSLVHPSVFWSSGRTVDCIIFLNICTCCHNSITCCCGMCCWQKA